MGRILIIGDVHGCHEEFDELLDKLAPTASDQLICVGDLICKGPSSVKVLRIAMRLKNFTTLIGNHELRFLNCWYKKAVPNIKPYDLATYEEMGSRYEEFMYFFANCPFYVDLKEALVVHAGLRPHTILFDQKKTDLTKLRLLEPENKPWYEFYKDSKPVVFGHWVRREPLLQENVIGLDTGCVYGGKLSAFILPGRDVISVKAKKIYVERKDKWE